MAEIFGSVCAKHKKSPVKIYSQCVGCEIDNLRESERALRARVARLEEAVKNMLESYKRAEECSCPYCREDFERERAEVDRLITANETEPTE